MNNEVIEECNRLHSVVQPISKLANFDFAQFYVSNTFFPFALVLGSSCDVRSNFVNTIVGREVLQLGAPATPFHSRRDACNIVLSGILDFDRYDDAVVNDPHFGLTDLAATSTDSNGVKVNLHVRNNLAIHDFMMVSPPDCSDDKITLYLWLATRADVILLLIDDVSSVDLLWCINELLNQHAGKVVVVQLDSCSNFSAVATTPDTNESLSSTAEMFWMLSKVIRTAHTPKIYRYSTHQRDNNSRTALVRDLQTVPALRIVRTVNSLERAIVALHTHCELLSNLSHQYFRCYWAQHSTVALTLLASLASAVLFEVAFLRKSATDSTHAADGQLEQAGNGDLSHAAGVVTVLVAPEHIDTHGQEALVTDHEVGQNRYSLASTHVANFVWSPLRWLLTRSANMWLRLGYPAAVLAGNALHVRWSNGWLSRQLQRLVHVEHVWGLYSALTENTNDRHTVVRRAAVCALVDTVSTRQVELYRVGDKQVRALHMILAGDVQRLRRKISFLLPDESAMDRKRALHHGSSGDATDSDESDDSQLVHSLPRLHAAAAAAHSSWQWCERQFARVQDLLPELAHFRLPALLHHPADTATSSNAEYSASLEEALAAREAEEQLMRVVADDLTDE